MESTRKHWLAVVTGLCMTSSGAATAQDNMPSSPEREVSAAPAPRAVSATANAAIDLENSARSLDGPVYEGTEESEPTSAAPHPLSRGSVDAAPKSAALTEVSRASIPKGRRAVSSPGRDVPWYRSPYAALVGVLVLIAGLSLILRRFVPTARPLAADALRVVGRTPLSAKQSAVLLHVGRRLVLVGVTAESVRTLAEITDAEEVAHLMGRVSATERPAAEAFDATLAREFGKYGDHAVAAQEEASLDDETVRETRGQLHNLLGRLRALQSA